MKKLFTLISCLLLIAPLLAQQYRPHTIALDGMEPAYSNRLVVHDNCEPQRNEVVRGRWMNHDEVVSVSDTLITFASGETIDIATGAIYNGATTVTLASRGIEDDFVNQGNPWTLEASTADVLSFFESDLIMVSYEDPVRFDIAEWDCETMGHLEGESGWQTMMYCPPYYEKQGETIYKVYPACNELHWNCEACQKPQVTREEATRVILRPQRKPRS